MNNPFQNGTTLTIFAKVIIWILGLAFFLMIIPLIGYILIGLMYVLGFILSAFVPIIIILGLIAIGYYVYQTVVNKKQI